MNEIEANIYLDVTLEVYNQVPVENVVVATDGTVSGDTLAITRPDAIRYPVSGRLVMPVDTRLSKVKPITLIAESKGFTVELGNEITADALVLSKVEAIEQMTKYQSLEDAEAIILAEVPVV